MADNVTADPGTGGAVFATALGTWSGDSANFPGCFIVMASGSEGAWTFAQAVGGAGAVAAGVQRMTLASDDPAVTSLSSINGKLPALGQALAASSVPVVLTAAQISTLTPLSTVAATQSGTWNITNVSGTVSLPTGAATSAKQPALGTAGTASSDVITVQGIAGMTALKVDGSAVTQPVSGTFWQATQPVSGTVAFSNTTIAVTNAGTFVVQENGAALTSLQLIDDIIVSQGTALGSTKVALAGGSVTTAAPTFTTGQINQLSLTTSGALRVDVGATSANGTAIKVDGSAVTQPVSGTVSITANSAVNVAQINGVTTSMGNGISGTGVQRVTIASDSTGTIAATQSGTWNVTNVSGTISLPTGAATSANQTLTNTPITPATATATKGTLIGVQYNSTQATFTDGQQGSLQASSRGAALVATGADTFNVTVNAALPAGTNGIGKLTANSGVTIGAVEIAAAQTLATVTTCSTVTSLTQMNGQAISMGTGVRAAGTQRVTIATDDIVPASQSGTWTVQPGNTANTTPWLVTDTPATSGGLSKSHLVSAASTNATNVKASAGQVYAITAFNTNASPRYLKFHNTAGTPTAGTSITDTFLIPGNASGAGLVLNIDKGIAFSTGIAFTLVTGIADSDSTGVGANDVVLNIYYK